MDEKAKNRLSQILITFLALLELGRIGVVSLEQEKDDDIIVAVKKQLSDKDFYSIQDIDEGQKNNKVNRAKYL